jgi:hypothetical protein
MTHLHLGGPRTNGIKHELQVLGNLEKGHGVLLGNTSRGDET